MLTSKNIFFLFFLFLAQPLMSTPSAPKVTIVVIVDQFAYHYITKLQKHFKHGLNFLIKNGVNYTNAYFPHGVPETTTGHNTINTGCLPKDHGAVTNSWVDENGDSVHYADQLDSSNTKVDGFSEQFSIKSKNDEQNTVFALSIKTHPAISCANKTGKAIWFDDQTGEFTSSPAYYEALPQWLADFNKEQHLKTLKQITWNTAYPIKSACYRYSQALNYDFSAYKFSLIKKHKIPVNQNENAPFEFFIRTPRANELLFELAKKCIDTNYNSKNQDKILIWLCLSPLDFLAHMYGPDCLETIDMIYHLDKQLIIFFNYLNKKIGNNDYLLVLCADHGIAHIPEILQKQGLKTALRISAKGLSDKINQHLKAHFKLTDLVVSEATDDRSKFDAGDTVVAFDPPSFYLNKQKFNNLKEATQEKILKSMKKFLLNQPGIKNVWTYDELSNTTFEPTDLEYYYKAQLYRGRMGDIICQVEPNCLLTDYPTGTSHMTPYEYDTHVPLIFYQKGVHEKKTINTRVWMPQLAVSLCKIHGIPKPTASPYDCLPGLF